MDLKTAFNHLIDNWEIQEEDFRRKHKYFKSTAKKGNRGISPESMEKLLTEAGYPFTPQNWELPKNKKHEKGKEKLVQ